MGWQDGIPETDGTVGSPGAAPAPTTTAPPAARPAPAAPQAAWQQGILETDGTVGSAPAPAPGGKTQLVVPNMGATESNFTYYGGDPSSPSSWKQTGEPIPNAPKPWDKYATPQYVAPVSFPEAAGKSVAATAETAAHLASGGAASVLGGMASIDALGLHATGLDSLLGLNTGSDAAKATRQKIENALTYQPRTEAGQQLSGAVDKTISNVAAPVFNAVESAATKVGGPGAGEYAHDVLTVAPALAGARGLVDTGADIARAAGNVGKKIIGPTEAPAGVTYDASGVAETPKAAPAAAPPADVPGASAATPPKFEEAPTTAAAPGSTEPALAKAAAPEVMAQNRATLKDVGLDSARKSAIAGDAQGAATDFHASRLDNEYGAAMKEGLDAERTALDNYSGRLVAQAGGTTGLDGTSLYNRGKTIIQPLQDLADHLDDQISALYKTARDQSQAPLNLPGFAETLDKPMVLSGDAQALLNSVRSYLKSSRVMDEKGNLLQMSGEQAEALRQELNSAWSPGSTANPLIGKLKDALDNDVISSGTGTPYAAARTAFAARKALLDDPEGISKLLDSSGPSGINRRVDYEKVADTLTRMPVDQFNHVVNTLESMTDGPMRPQAQMALGEIRSQFMQRMQEQGQAFKGNQWNNKGVTQYLNANNARIARVFKPSELQQLKTLNDAGNILSIDRSYPGQVVQAQNLAQRGVLKGVEHGAEALGAHLAGPPGAVVGNMIGKGAAKALGSSMSRKAALARFEKL